jgi:hypothetical protein
MTRNSIPAWSITQKHFVSNPEAAEKVNRTFSLAPPDTDYFQTCVCMSVRGSCSGARGPERQLMILADFFLIIEWN